jgi:hypothetical protein
MKDILIEFVGIAQTIANNSFSIWAYLVSVLRHTQLAGHLATTRRQVRFHWRHTVLFNTSLVTSK